MLTLVALACSPDPTGSDPTDSETDPTVPTHHTTTFVETGSTPIDPFELLSARPHPEIGSILLADWNQRDAGTVHVEYTFEDDVWLLTPERVLEPGSHEELLLGIPFGSDVTWRVVQDGDAGQVVSDDQLAANDPLPAGAPKVHVGVFDPAKTDPAAPYLFLSLADPGGEALPSWIEIVDRQGRPVWATRSRPDRVSKQVRVAKDGLSLFVDQNSFWSVFDGGVGSSIVQILIDGTVLHEFDAPGEHHDWTDLPDGSIAYGATIDWPGYSDEYLQVVRLDGSTDTVFRCAPWLVSIGVTDVCMSNTLNYDEPSDSYLFSMFTLETVIRIDASTGKVVSWYGHTDGAYAFDPPDSEFWWQHGGYITDAGTFLTSTDRTADGVETVVREYQIDDQNQVLHQVWSFGIGEGIYGEEMGDAIRLANGNTLHNYGNAARIREVTTDHEVVWDLSWDTIKLGRAMPLADLWALVPAERP